MSDRIKHVAMIMDGNGRWAQSRYHSRIWGHIRGASVVSNIVEEADELGLKALTLYAFSSENWSRPEKEVMTLFVLLKKFVQKERKRILKNKICFNVIGDLAGLPSETKKLIFDLEEETADAEGLNLTFAFGYSGRNEILRSVNQHIKNNPGKEISEIDLTNNLYNPKAGDVDLLIRTGGDQRVSNFLLWQIAYSEFFFTQTKWPDFSREEFRGILYQVSGRERRFGNIHAPASYDKNMQDASKNKESAVRSRL